MYTPTILVLCLAVAVYGFPEGQIVGGRDAPVGKFPYQVSLRQNGNHFCGGSIINSRTILTAAHCVAGLRNLKAVTVQVGTNQLKSGGVSYGVEKVDSHPKYNSVTIANDIAVIRLNADIHFTDLIQPIKLATSDVPEGGTVTLSGWGTTRNGGQIPNNLQEIDLHVYSQSKCKLVHWNVQASQVCTFTKSGEGACHGDSGGPLVGGGIQIGIVSFGRPCGIGYPDVFTRVSSFVPWIQSKMN
ncbi:PREDICTED: chymotrypsin-1-like [Dufourea novaeangliae]|uniref:chymotrypsin-1-like n=1 Tax=Dufourea novaeangliae TaxID=178035 RepID=UPI0007671E5D|nr:PREDICTED: chymotrypsin-1-like [Dufourea novaeangliae]